MDTSPRPIIVHYLNYADKAMLLQANGKMEDLDVEGYKLLLFADYSAEVFKKRKSFVHICATLYHKRKKITLAYPATLYVLRVTGKTKPFTPHWKQKTTSAHKST